MDENMEDNSIQRLKAQTITQLRNQIIELKELHLYIRSRLATTPFGDIEYSTKPVETLLKEFPLQSIDMQRQYCYELFQISGLCCKKSSATRMVFIFREDHNADEFALEILNKEQFELGRSIVPFSINFKHILRETPLGDSRTLKPLIKNVRHRIDCNSIRREQYKKLKAVSNDATNFFQTCNLEYTCMMLSFFNIKDKIADCNEDITLYLLYKSSEVRPYKMKLDTIQFMSLTQDVDTRLRTFFEDFMVDNLQTAFEQIQKYVDREMSWVKEYSEPINVMESSDSGSGASSSSEHRQKRRKRSGKKTDRVRKIAVNQNHSENLSLEKDAESAESSDEGAIGGEADTPTKDTINTVKKKQVEKATVKPAATRSTAKLKTIPGKPVKNLQKSKMDTAKKSQSSKLKETQTNSTATKNTDQYSLRQSMLNFKHLNSTTPEGSTASNQNLIASTPLNPANPLQPKFISDIASMSPIEQMPNKNSKKKSGK